MKIAVQCDFDGTVTEEDVSFLLLDTYLGPKWRDYLVEYTEGRIPVGTFNKRVFGMITADRQTMTDLVLTSERVKVRSGFREMVEFCKQKSFYTGIVSNGLIFYIEAIISQLGIDGLEIHAAENEFYPDGMKVKYIGPDGDELEVGYKEAHTEALRKRGYDVIYLGNGRSDIYPARRSIHVFATGELLQKCREENLACIPFNDFFEVLDALKTLELD
jgi:2-hydroxy-3-keto-5-methylthiopentenyl-1-phosphate phosphatase